MKILFSLSRLIYPALIPFISIATFLMVSSNSVSTISKISTSDKTQLNLSLMISGSFPALAISRSALTKHDKCYFMSSATVCNGSRVLVTFTNLTSRTSTFVSTHIFLIFMPIFFVDTLCTSLSLSLTEDTFHFVKCVFLDTFGGR